uniref:Uncharacterized protein n=1 Tax=Anguilla anguilla TaxID=7936 RepID=A0A0E9T080_ANGAN
MRFSFKIHRYLSTHVDTKKSCVYACFVHPVDYFVSN